MRKVMVLLTALTLLAAAGCGGCAGKPYKGIATAQVTLNKFARFVEGFDRSVKAFLQSEDARCTKAHTATEDGKLDKVKYAKCISPALKLSVIWTGEWKGKKTGKGVLPAIQDAQRATRHSLDGAFDYVKANEDACGKKDGEEAKKCKEKVGAWRKVIKPAVCGLVPVVDRAVKIGAYKASTDATYTMIKGLAQGLCK